MDELDELLKEQISGKTVFHKFFADIFFKKEFSQKNVGWKAEVPKVSRTLLHRFFAVVLAAAQNPKIRRACVINSTQREEEGEPES